MLASAAIMGVVTPILTGHALVTIGWRNLFYIIGAAGILITALMFFY